MNTTGKIGICPVTSEALLRFALNRLRERGVFAFLPGGAFREDAKKLADFLPSHYLPELYLDLPLMGGESEGMAAVFDCYDRCRIDWFSDGRYFHDLNIPALTAPEDRDTLCAVRPDQTYEVLEKTRLTPVAHVIKEYPLLSALADTPLLCRIEPDGRRRERRFRRAEAAASHREGAAHEAGYPAV